MTDDGLAGLSRAELLELVRRRRDAPAEHEAAIARRDETPRELEDALPAGHGCGRSNRATSSDARSACATSSAASISLVASSDGLPTRLHPKRRVPSGSPPSAVWRGSRGLRPPGRVTF